MKVTISSTVAENSIPADLIVNWDQIGTRMVPVNDWTGQEGHVVHLQMSIFKLALYLYSRFCTTNKEEDQEKYHSEASRTNYTNDPCQKLLLHKA